MTQIVSSISGIEIYAPSAGNAPTNSSEVSAIASAYQVVSSTATQLYAGTAFLTSVNGAPVSASRAGNAANASMANSAYYDGTGRLISALPDNAAVSSIASGYVTGVSATVANNSASWGGGGAQVVTATGSAAVGYGLGAQTAVSSINGSALLPYGFSAISGNSANWNSTRTAVTANSANWNSVYNTVNSSSASWGGGGGSVVSPSGTIFVRGSSIEGTNSAVLTATDGTGFETVFFPQNTHLGPQMTMLVGGSVPDSGATLIMPMEQAALEDFRVILSGNGYTGVASASGTIPMGTLTASIPMEGITGAISASANRWFNLSGGVPLTARKDGGIVVTGVGELAWNSALADVSSTVANNSASWGQGGVDSATVSSIASSYAKSAASSKLDTTAQVVTATGSASAGLWGSQSAMVSSLNGSAILPYGYSALSANSANWTSVYNTVNSNSATWNDTGVSEATVSSIASSYAESAASGKADSSSLSSYALSSDVSGCIDTVSANSASWGGSALALSAGPGVKLEKVGDTLVASTDETVLYSATAYAPGDTQQSYSLIETPMNFETVRVLAYRPLANGAPWFGSVDIQIANLYNYTASNTLMAMPYAFVSTANNIFYEGQYFINNITSTSWEDGSSTQRKTTETAYTTGYYAHIYKIIGINRTAGV